VPAMRRDWTEVAALAKELGNAKWQYRAQGQAIGGTVEVLSKALDQADVTLCGSLRVMTTLDFLQH